MPQSAKLYVMKSTDGAIKIGYSADPEARRSALGREIELIHSTGVIAFARRVEALAHRIMSLHGTQIKGEWFRGTAEDAVRAIELAIEQAEGNELELGGEFKDGRGRPRKYKDRDNGPLVSVHLRLTPDMIEWIEQKVRDDPTMTANKSTIARRIFAQAMDNDSYSWRDE